MRSNAQRHALNTFLMVAVQIVTKVGMIGVALVAARTLGVAGFGQYTYALGIAGVFSIVADLGLTPYVIGRVATDPAAGPRLVGEVLLLRLVLVLPLLSGYMGLEWLMNRDTAVAVLGIGLIGVQAMLSITDSFVLLFSGYHRFDLVGRVTLVSQLVGAVAGVVLVRLWPHALALIVGMGVGQLLALLDTVRICRREFALPAPRIANWATHLRRGLPFAATGILNQVYVRFDSVVLFQLLGSTVVGHFNAASSIVANLTVIPYAINGAFFPLVAELYKTSAHEVRRRLLNLQRYLLLVGVPIAVGGCMLARPLMVLVYGTNFAESGVFFALRIASLPFLFLFILYSGTLGAAGHQRMVVWVSLATAVVNVGVNLLVMPRYGAAGAMAVKTSTEVLSFLLLVAFAPADLRTHLGWRAMAAILGSSGIMAAVLVMLGQTQLLVRILIAGLVYAAATLLTGAVTKSELRMVMARVPWLRRFAQFSV